MGDDFLKNINELIECNYNIKIYGITDDSRLVEPGYLFVATKGYNVDHFDYIKMAIENGCSFVICDRKIEYDIPHLIVENINDLFYELCRKFYDLDLDKFNFIGITGTDGKTTTATIIKNILNKCAYIGTNGVELDTKEIPTSNTTPCVSELYKDLKYVCDNGINNVVMEVSSEALLHDRVKQLRYSIVGFTNITGDHLNVHKTFENYVKCKIKLLDLLKDDGVIFISIGEGEIENITKCADEVFGESNRIGIVPRVMKSGGGKGFFFSPNIDYIIIYAKNINSVTSFREPISEDIINRLYTSIETTGDRKGERYRPFGLYQSSLDPLRGCSNQRYFIEAPDGTLLLPPGNVIPDEKIDGGQSSPITSDDKVWRWTRDRYITEKEKGNIEFKKSNGVLIDANGQPAQWNVYTKIWLSDRQEEGMTPVNFITKFENRHSAKELNALDIPFDFAKPIGLISYLAKICNVKSDEIVLDFFSGSATTAHAVMQLNAEDGGKRKFIMVQLPEETDKKSEAYKAGYKNICEIGKERIRRAGKKIKSESPLTTQDLDVGFRVLKLDSTNMEDVYYAPAEVKQEQLNLFADNVKPDRTGEDLLFQSMLDLGATLDSKIEKIEVNGKVVYNVAEGYLVACFDKEVSDDVVKAIAQMQPQYAVLRDSSLADDSTATNFEQIFKTFSPTTTCKIL